ncbi:hypothetical protein C4565_07260 [Candidatus Parcubacteria bacterium]|nr:MAG: hypothetical protein C4565_07260 [Candidatus Parcubacteria bacterium]
MAKKVDDSDIPKIAGFLYDSYSLDGLNLICRSLKEDYDSISQRYVKYSPEDQDKIRHILEVEIIAKFCQHAEDLAMLTLVFKSSYDDANQEKTGLFNTMARYGLSQIVDFYQQITIRKLQIIAKFFGYPPIDIQSAGVKEFLEKSCETIREEFKKIADLYLELRDVYDAYKHGYRISFAKDNKTLEESIVFVNSKGETKLIKFEKTDVEKCVKMARRCKQLADAIMKNHHERAKYEESGGEFGNVNITTVRKPDDPEPPELKLMFSKRGETRKKELEEGEQTYNLFKEELEKTDSGKLVALDLDNKKIIAKDYSIEGLVSLLKESGNSSRLLIRRIGKNASVGIDIY